MAEAHERVVDLGGLRGRGLLISDDGLHDVALERLRRHREAGQADVGEALADALERGGAGAHDEHALVLRDQAADGVDDGLRAAGAGERGHHERVARVDLRDDVLLLGIRVEQQGVGDGRALVLRDRVHGRVRLADAPLRGGVACDGIDDEVVEVLGVLGERPAHLGERGDDEARLHRERGQVRGEAAQAVDDRLRLEGAVLHGERDERVGVERDLELLLERPRERRVEERLALEAHLVVAAVAADRERAQEHGRAELLVGEAPLGEADGQVDRLDAAGRHQLDALLRDAVRGLAGAPEREVVADEGRQQRRLARDELREAARVRGAQLDAGAGRVHEVQERRGAADAGQLLAPLAPAGLGHVAAPELHVADPEVVGAGAVVGSIHVGVL